MSRISIAGPMGFDMPEKFQLETPLLSILIPTYNYPKGVSEALASMGLEIYNPGIEIIISDDSLDPESSEAIERAVKAFPRITYRRNRPSLGAVDNWNSLLDEASGRYCLLLHHDEKFEESTVLTHVISLLSKSDTPDGIVLSCKLIGQDRQPRIHFPPAVAKLLAIRWPGYLLRRNFMGPPSCLIMKRAMYLRYDPSLTHLVDVELYVRTLLQLRPRLVFLNPPGLLTDITVSTSITNTIRREIPQITHSELISLQARGILNAGSAWVISEKPTAILARIIEATIWAAFRGAQRAIAVIRRIIADI